MQAFSVLSTVTIAREGFLLLRRDKVFLPAVVVGLGIAILANLASSWSVEDFSKILFDVGVFGFRLTGGLVATLWGTKALTDSRQEGALEVQLAAPVSRTSWLLGKYLGMVMALFLLSLVLVAAWQGLMLVNNFGFMNARHVAAFGMLGVEWLVLAALATFFACFCRQAVAMFGTMALWIAGLASALVVRTITSDTSEGVRAAASSIARIWNLQQFNLVDYVFEPSFLPRAELLTRGAYGATLIFLLISLSCVIISRRDAVQ